MEDVKASHLLFATLLREDLSLRALPILPNSQEPGLDSNRLAECVALHEVEYDLNISFRLALSNVPDHAIPPTNWFTSTTTKPSPSTHSNLSSSRPEKTAQSSSEAKLFGRGHGSPTPPSDFQQGASLSQSPPETRQEPDSAHRCSKCDKVFDKAYERNKHFNRKHNRRYRCTVEGCQQQPFGLQTDLKRHTKSRHSKPHSSSLHRCPLDNCQHALKPFSRKDHLTRHLQTCHSLNQWPSMDFIEEQ